MKQKEEGGRSLRSENVRVVAAAASVVSLKQLVSDKGNHNDAARTDPTYMHFKVL